MIFAADLHGNHPVFDALFEKAAALQADAIVLGGDILPLPGRHSDPLLHQRTFTRGWLAPRLMKFHRDNPSIRVFGMLGNDAHIVCDENYGLAVPVDTVHHSHELLGLFGIEACEWLIEDYHLWFCCNH